MTTLKTPVLLIIFNRPKSTKLAFEAIKNSRPTKLFVAADGPRNGNLDDELKCKITRDIIKVDWECEVKYLYSDVNLGCGKGPAKAISWFFEHVESGIILEDDCIPEPDFFMFCQEMLKFYENDGRIFNICGSNLGFQLAVRDSYFVSKFMNMNGWATWKRTAKNIDYSLKFWDENRIDRFKLYKQLRYNLFDFDYNWVLFWEERIIETKSRDNVSWWDYQWILNQLERKQVSIIPSINLVKNIGFDEDATHTKSPDHLIANLPTSKMVWPILHPTKLKFIASYEEIFVKKRWLYCSKLSLYKTFILLIKGVLIKILKS